MMKDLYTFDHSSDAALKTYEAVREAYNNLFNELKLPYLVADADSGNMGGKLSHEYHFVSPKGEDNVWSCNSCSYVVNEELVEKRTETAAPGSIDIVVSTGISVDKSTAINIHIPNPASTTQSEVIEWDQISDFINLHAVKKALPEGVEIDTGIESATLNGLLHKTTQTIDLFDRSLSSAPNSDSNSPSTNVDLTVTKPGDACPHCSNGKLHVQRAIEVAHTFHLGTRYSSPLNAVVALPDQNLSSPIQMGCHGIGVSRIIGAVASLLSDSKGLNWPRAIAPYDTIIIPSPQMKDQDADVVHDVLLSGTNGKVDIVLDDRAGKSLGWKLKDADLIGYPVVVVVGRGWKEKREVEVQCRRLGVRKEIWVGELKSEIMGLLEQL
jgi:prolyl-tRNA synthetase